MLMHYYIPRAHVYPFNPKLYTRHSTVCRLCVIVYVWNPVFSSSSFSLRVRVPTSDFLSMRSVERLMQIRAKVIARKRTCVY